MSNAAGAVGGLHPILGCAADIAAALDQVAETSPIFMSVRDKQAAIDSLHREKQRLAELELRVLAATDVDKIGADTGHRSTATYVAQRTRQTHQAVSKDVRLSRRLDGDFEATRRALAEGRLSVAHAEVIVHAIEQFSDDITAEERLLGEKHLIVEAEDKDPAALRILGKRLFEVINPDEADKKEGEALEREEREARKQTKFSMRSNGDGTHSFFGKLPDLHALILKKTLHGLVAPRRIGGARFDADGKKIPYSTLLGHGLMELLEHLPDGCVPTAGGVPATIVVTMDLDSLLSGVGAATLDDGTRVSASEARRLACQAKIIPMVLDGDSQPLDLGRSQRLFSKYQRVALGQRDGGCTAEGCDLPPSWCEAHHDIPWSEGGPTDLDNGRLLCHHHHVLAHDDAYLKTRLPNGAVRFRRRQ